MSDDSQNQPAPAPAAPVKPPQPAPVAPVAAAPQYPPHPSQIVAANEQAWAGRLLASHDAARAAAPTVRLTAITDFTMVTDEHPDGRTIRMGEEFEVSEFDLPRYLGKGLPRAEGAALAG